MAVGNNAVNIFVTDSDETSFNASIDICRMLKGVTVYGCYGEAEALKLASQVVPHALIISCVKCAGGSSLDTVKKFFAINPDIIVIATGLVGDLELESKMLKAGALSFFFKPVDGDKLFFTIKNISEIVRQRTLKSGSSGGQGSKADKSDYYLGFITIKSYSDVNAMSKNIGSVLKVQQKNNRLKFVRLFSFFYDFFVRSFLRDKEVSSGLFIDNSRLILYFRCFEGVEELLKCSIYYDMAKEYLYQDGKFFGFKIYFELIDNQILIDDSIFCLPKGRCLQKRFSFIYDSSFPKNGKQMDYLKGLASDYSAHIPLFETFCTFLSSADADMDNHMLKECFAKIDEGLQCLSSSDTKQWAEDCVAAELIKATMVMSS